MPGLLFFSWLEVSNTGIQAQHNSKLLLLLDSCEGHGSLDTFSDLIRFEVSFLSSNMTSCLQCLDAGIITAV